MKKTLALGLALLVLGGSLPASWAQATTVFSDVPKDHDYQQAIEYLQSHNIVEGYETEDKTSRQFRPDNRLNRAEFTKIVIEAKYSKDDISACLKNKELKDWKTMYFPDVKIEAWYSGPICVAKEKGIVDGYPSGDFKPEQPINFAEASKVVANTFNISSPTSRGDVPSSIGIEESDHDPWYKPYVSSLSARKAVPQSIRSFAKNITRGEMAKMIHGNMETVDTPSLTYESIQTTSEKEEDLPQIDSCDALVEKLELDKEQPMAKYLGGGPMAMEDSAPAPNAAKSMQAPMAAGTGLAPSEDYSSTNVQVEGVDEADIIKNDGKYIYLIKGKTIRIVEAYPADNLKEVVRIELDDEEFYPQELYVDENQLVIIGNISRYRHYPGPMPMIEPLPGIMAPSIMPYPDFGGSRMNFYLYDITDKTDPKRQRSIEIEGNYTSSRKVGKNIYFVLNQYIPYYHILQDQEVGIMLPVFNDSANEGADKPIARCMDVQYFPGFTERNYLIVAGLNIADLDSDLNRKVYLGSSQNIYASKESLYVATPRYEEARIRKDRDIVYESQQTTLVYRFKLSAEEIEYQNKGSVPGNILNQFSMDESGASFRIATTTDVYRSNEGNQTGNNLFILDKSTMKKTGEITDIAPGERIKSVRFMGNRAYLVTFRNVDPLFVIDVSSATEPKILGKLKIPGWSDYLHPYDETHLLGFGREVDPAAETADRITSEFLWGMKLSLFDVSDLEKPIELFKEVIGTRGTTSELLNNHKALLFDKEKNLLAFPINITEKKDPEMKLDYNNVKTTFSGGIVYSVDLTNGFTQRGKVTHYTSDEIFQDAGEYFYGEPDKTIQRMIYIGPSLFSVSPGYIRAYDIQTIESQNTLKLEGVKQEDVNYLEDDAISSPPSIPAPLPE